VAVNSPGVLKITAGNYGGKLGKHHFHLKDLIEPRASGGQPSEVP
jgi:formylmethanofuran--tetrahydromethanopterin N-formyltransferase